MYKRVAVTDPHPLYGAAYRFAESRYGWLLRAIGVDDFRQAVSLALLAPDCGPGHLRNAVDRAMYQLAREYGFVRPSAGLPRGSTGQWTRVDDELLTRSGRTKCQNL